MLWATIGVVCTTLLSTTIFFLVPNTSTRLQSTNTPPPRPNPYIHLDKLLTNVSLNFEPVINFPQVTLQYRNGDGERRMHEDGRDYATPFGMIYPDDRRVVADQDLSTIVQFRNLDYAMEHCVLHIEVPQAASGFDPAVRLSEPSTVDVWSLDLRTELSRYVSGAMDQAPSRRALMATFSISRTIPSVTESFLCRTGEYTTIELTCAPGFVGCAVDFWQDQRVKPSSGVFLMQYPFIAIEEGM